MIAPDRRVAATAMSLASVAKWLANEQTARLLREWLTSHPEIPKKAGLAAGSSPQVQDEKEGAEGTTPTTIVVGMLQKPTEKLVRPWCLLTECPRS